MNVTPRISVTLSAIYRTAVVGVAHDQPAQRGGTLRFGVGRGGLRPHRRRALASGHETTVAKSFLPFWQHMPPNAATLDGL